MAKEVIVYGADWCPSCKRLIEKLNSEKVQFEYRDVEKEDVGKEHVGLAGGDIPEGKRGIPTIVVDGVMQVYPDDEWLKEHLGLGASTTPDTRVHDVVMVGAGPASLAAAIYTTREDLDTVLYEKGVVGGLASITDWVDNYPGFPEGISGMDLGESLRKQAERFGAQIELGEVLGIKSEDGVIELDTTDGPVRGKATLIATGSDYKRLGIPGEDDYYARGVHFCATCDGAFYRDKRLVVVGGGNSAVQEAMFLTKFATKIDMLVRGDKMRASEVLQQDLKKHADKITVHFNTTTDEILGDGKLVTGVKGTKKGKEEIFETDGVFVFIGLKPNTGFLAGTDVELDEIGLIKTDDLLQTAIPGVFAAGDVRSGATMQIASAIGEGATAALRIREYLEELAR